MIAQPSLIDTPARRPATLLDALPTDQQPAYRINQLGGNACNVTELIAAVVGGPRQLETAGELLKTYHGDIRRMTNAPTAELATITGIGDATAARLKAALALGLRLMQSPPDRTTINSPADVAAILQPEMSHLEVEQLRTVLLDTRNNVIEILTIYSGSVNSSQVRIAEVMRPAIRYNAPALVAVHNHPSGDPTPSPDDVAVTRSMVQAGKLLDIDLLDHIIIAGARWVSLKERGLGFS